MTKSHQSIIQRPLTHGVFVNALLLLLNIRSIIKRLQRPRKKTNSGREFSKLTITSITAFFLSLSAIVSIKKQGLRLVNKWFRFDQYLILQQHVLNRLTTYISYVVTFRRLSLYPYSSYRVSYFSPY